MNPAFLIFNDQGSPNAFATPKRFDPQYGDGSVVFGYQLLNSEIQQTGPDNFTVATIMAHEFAHILQFNSENNYRRNLVSWKPTIWPDGT